jgi:MFS family permease
VSDVPTLEGIPGRSAILPPQGIAPRARAELKRHWFVILVACVGMACGPQGIVNLSFGVFITPLVGAFGWAQSSVAGWLGFCSLGKSVCDPIVGWLSDRFGPRPVILVSLLACSAVLACAPVMMAHGLAWFYAIGLLVGGFGSGVGHLPYTKIVVSRFSIARGTALGIAVAGVGLAATVGPPLAQRIIDAWSWRSGFIFLSVFGLIAFPFVLFLRPERARSVRDDNAAIETGRSLGEALRSPAFWILCVGFFLLCLALATTANLVPFMTSSGLSRAQATLAMSVLGMLSISGRVIFGFIIDRVPVTLVLASLLLLQALVFVLLSVSHGQMALVIVPTIGLCLGGEVASVGYCTAHFFGTRAYGRVVGIFGIAMAAGTGLGPYIFSRLYEAHKSYAVSFDTFAVLLLMAAGAFLVAGRFPKFQPSAAVESALTVR